MTNPDTANRSGCQMAWTNLTGASRLSSSTVSSYSTFLARQAYSECCRRRFLSNWSAPLKGL